MEKEVQESVQIFDEVDTGLKYMRDFKQLARDVLLPQDNYEHKEYDVPIDLIGAYKKLKQYINKPMILH